MQINQIIAEIDAEITRLSQVRVLLNGTNGTSPIAPKKRTLSSAARARIAAAQKARWAKAKRASN